MSRARDARSPAAYGCGHDRAGNLSTPSTIALELGHYQVVTRVDLVTTQKDPLIGTLKVTIIGRGFRDNGPISKVYLDRVHRGPPWDIELDPAPLLTVTDRQISGIVLDDNRESGSYRIGLLQQRPTGQNVLYFTAGPMFDFRGQPEPCYLELLPGIPRYLSL